MKKILILGLLTGLIPTVYGQPYHYSNHPSAKKPATYSQVQKGYYYHQNQAYDNQTADLGYMTNDESETIVIQALSDNDRFLGENIRRELKNQFPEATFTRIFVEIDGGAITLRGTVDSSQEKKAIQETVESVSGISNIDNLIDVKKADGAFNERGAASYWSANTEAAPSNLAEQVRVTLRNANYGKNAENINISAFNGTVTLQGTVESQSMKNSIENKVRQISGVTTIKNQLTVVSDGNSADHMNLQLQSNNAVRNAAAIATDKQISDSISSKLNSGSFTTNLSGISFSVQNGIVTLRGTVNSPEQSRAIEKQIKAISGVKSISNQINIIR